MLSGNDPHPHILFPTRTPLIEGTLITHAQEINASSIFASQDLANMAEECCKYKTLNCSLRIVS